MKRVTLLLSTLITFVTACATPRFAKSDAPPQGARTVRVFDGDDGSQVTWQRLVDAAASNEVVLIGENHGHPLGLASAAALFEDLLARSPKTALSMEFFERDEQSRLDDYLTGITDYETFKRRTSRSEGNFPPGHHAMIELAKAAKRPVHAANAPRPYVRAARSEGYDRLRSLSPEQQRLFFIPPQLFGGDYRRRFDDVMTPSGDTRSEDERRASLDQVFRSQSLWDWTMADSIARGLAEDELPVVHVVGRFHVDFDGGTVQALDALRFGTRRLVVSYVDAWSDTLRDEDRGRGDFVIYVGPSANGN